MHIIRIFLKTIRYKRNILLIICNILQCVLLFNFAFAAKEDKIILGFQKTYNVILISIDTLRADHLGCYGYFRNTSPNIDKLAKEGILFEQAISQATWTLPSHASIFTSQYVPVHGVYFFNKLPDSAVTLAEVLENNGYATAAFTGGCDILSIFGLDQGFDVFYDTVKNVKQFGSFNETVPLAIQWLHENKGSIFFLFIHGYDVHEPYHVPDENMFDTKYKGIIDDMILNRNTFSKIYRNSYVNNEGRILKLTSKDINHIIAHYDSGIHYADEKIGDLLKELKKLKLLDDTIIIILSDHGEGLGERGRLAQHGINFYDEVVRVPLIIRHPSIKGPKRIKTQAQLIDVMPTILDFLGIPKNKEAQGNSLVPLIDGKAPPDFNEYVFSEGWMIRTLKFKMIKEEELYDLKEDHRELNNRAIKNPKILSELMQQFLKWRKDNLQVMRDLRLKEKFKDTSYW